MKKKLHVLFMILFLSITFIGHSQMGAFSCAELERNPALYQSCATDVPFQNSVGGNNENYNTSCIREQFRGPTWFFMKIQSTGDIRLQIRQVNSRGNGTDVDFVLWGPFFDMNNICEQLNQSKEVDCSWLPDSVERAYIPNAVAGEIYILLVDNYSNQQGQISISQIGGSGSSDCSFLSSVKLTDTSGNNIETLSACKPYTTSIRANIDISDFPGNPSDLRFNYKWYKDSVLISSSTDSMSNTNVLPNITQSGTYKVEVTAYDSTDPSVDLDNLTVSTDQVEINLHTLPSISLTSSSTCTKEQPLLSTSIPNIANLNSAIDVLSYQWFRNGVQINNATASSLTAPGSGNYYVIVSNGPCGSVQSNSISITETPLIRLDSNTTICEDESYTIIPTITNVSNLINPTYQWYKNNQIIPGATTNTYIVTANNQTKNTTAQYHVIVSEQNICDGQSNSVSVTVNQIPVINTTPIVIEFCDNNTPNYDGIAPIDLTQYYNQITNNVAGLTLKYYLNEAFTQLISNPENFTNTNPFSQTIYVKASDETQTPPCPSTTTAIIKLYISPYPKNNLLDTYYICVDENNYIIRQADIHTHLNNSEYSFQWYAGYDALSGYEIPGQTNSSFISVSENQYSVQITNINSASRCSSVFNFDTQFTQTPSSIASNPIEIIAFDTKSEITAVAFPPSEDYEYAILPDLWQDSPVFENLESGHYTLMVRNKNGCGEVSATFVIMDYPKFFTPNNDGHNDTWNIRGSSVVNIKSIYIFDRYGKLLKELSPNGEGWNGIYNSRKMPADDYWFTIEYQKDGVTKQFKSHFALKR
jgi:gliding motility-associated-like protein